ncbi:RNA polymerase sigma factor [Kribbia dieselivorans]|uniref:RNA polymerase sigma factor n=1 Tax=Kribbia dieselivorans TaxID=331526 RepID=UPI000838501D|nr:sigma-70 family RNA polymerase sigma factor [Kribbia dieselivorans]
MRQPFEQAVRQHGATVLRVCHAVLGSDAEADDAWSETFLAALAAWPDLDDDTNVEGWLVRVAHFKAIDIIRRRARQAVPTAEPPERVSTEGVPGRGPSELWVAVQSLPERQRVAVAYHYLGGLAHSETAAIVGSSPAAVRRAASDGIATLRRMHGADLLLEGTHS